MQQKNNLVTNCKIIAKVLVFSLVLPFYYPIKIYLFLFRNATFCTIRCVRIFLLAYIYVDCKFVVGFRWKLRATFVWNNLLSSFRQNLKSSVVPSTFTYNISDCSFIWKVRVSFMNDPFDGFSSNVLVTFSKIVRSFGLRSPERKATFRPLKIDGHGCTVVFPH